MINPADAIDPTESDLPGSDPFTTPERQALAAAARAFAQRHVAPHLPAWEDAGALPRDLHLRAAQAGLLGVGYPEDVGGQGGTIIDQAIVTEAVLGAGGSGGLIAGLFTHGIALPHVIDEVRRRRTAGDRDGADHLGRTIVAPVLGGTAILSLAVTEPDGGSDVAHLRTTARRTGAGFVVSGAKTYITSATRADAFVVAARTGGPGAGGISLLVVPRDSPGVGVSAPLRKMGWHCSDTGEITFDDVAVPQINLLGAEAGFASLARHFLAERLSLAVTAYATAQRCLDLTRRWCADRETFGRPLASRQVVRHTLVEMHRRTDVARTYTRAALAAAGAAEPAPDTDLVVRALLAKQTAVEACDWVVDKSVQLHGGLGYMRETEVERHYRDSKVLAIGGGATEVMTDLVARLLAI